ncbi:MAG: type II secretion system minor pseudopilin GspK [Syntrophales bacterium]|nr:type II secretion system minor pseudopilin GspK [Syntrophales bacterium]
MPTLLRDRGVALIVVILTIAIIVSLTLQMNRAGRGDIYSAANLRDGVRLYYMAKSGFNFCQALLLDDQNNFDALNEDWAIAEKVAAKGASLFDEGLLRLVMEDETGKINVNKLVSGNGYNIEIKDVLTRLLLQPEFGLDRQSVDDILDALKDWIDKDDEITGGGAETPYYAALENPYKAKNGPLDCIEELMMIKGITRELYEGTANRPGLKDLLTVYGEGKININTAPLLVLRALSPTMTAEVAEKIDQHRKTVGEDLSSADWYKRVVAGVEINASIITVRSNHFRIVSQGVMGNMTRTVQGVVLRDKGKKSLKILSWKES